MAPGMYDTDLTPYALKGFLHGGARYTFNLNIGLDPNIAADLKLPSDIRLYGETPKATWGDRTTYFFEPMFNGQVMVESSLAPTIDKYKATGYITADIRNVNIEGTSTVTLMVPLLGSMMGLIRVMRPLRRVPSLSRISSTCWSVNWRISRRPSGTGLHHRYPSCRRSP